MVSFCPCSASIHYFIACVDRVSFQNTTKWLEDVIAERSHSALLVLVGNKTDLTERRQVSVEEGEQKAKEWGALYMETSAMAGSNVKGLFKKIALALPGALGLDNGGGQGQDVSTTESNGKGTEATGNGRLNSSGLVDVKLANATFQSSEKSDSKCSC